MSCLAQCMEEERSRKEPPGKKQANTAKATSRAMAMTIQDPFRALDVALRASFVEVGTEKSHIKGLE